MTIHLAFELRNLIWVSLIECDLVSYYWYSIPKWISRDLKWVATSENEPVADFVSYCNSNLIIECQKLDQIFIFRMTHCEGIFHIELLLKWRHCKLLCYTSKTAGMRNPQLTEWEMFSWFEQYVLKWRKYHKIFLKTIKSSHRKIFLFLL